MVLKGLSDEGFDTVSPEKLIREYRNGLVIITSGAYRNNIYDQLDFSHFPPNRIINPRGGVLTGICGNQYFDYFMRPCENEIFVDVGCFDGRTSLEFSKWANGNYKRIYAFEANPLFRDRCQEFFRQNNVNEVQLVGKAAWSGKDRLKFEASPYDGGAKLGDSGDVIVDADSIDNVVAGERVTFIKMDIEGAEFRALLGAENTIRKWKPKLAISIYHKPEDVIEIPYLILSMNKDYKMGIRQYTSDRVETILYAE